MTHPNIDPTIIQIGPLAIRWYGLMYVIGYIVGIGIMKKLIKKGHLHLTKEQLDKLVLNLIIGMFIGSRLFYVVIYNWDYYSKDLLRVFRIWEGGLSFHGAVTGMAIALILSARKFKLPTFELLDSCALAGAPGLFFGRIGNFINGELYGRVTDHPFGMVFQDPEAGSLPRHPSQLYEAFGEGIILFLILFFIYKKMEKGTWVQGLLTFSFIFFYGIIRFLIEYTREPDAALGFYFGNITMGQILCSIMVVVGLIGIMWRVKGTRRT